MTIAHEEIRVQLSQVQLDMTHAVRAINTAQDAQLLACSGEALKGHAHTRHTDYRVEDCDFDFACTPRKSAFVNVDDI